MWSGMPSPSRSKIARSALSGVRVIERWLAPRWASPRRWGDVRVVAAGLERRRSGLDEAPRHEHRAPRPRDAVPVGEVAAVAARRLLPVADARDGRVVRRAPELGVLRALQPPCPHGLERGRKRRPLGQERQEVRAADLVDPLLGEAHPVLGPTDSRGGTLAVHAVQRPGVERPVGVVQERALRPSHLGTVHGRGRQMELAGVGNRRHETAGW